MARPKKEPNDRAQMASFRLYQGEKEKVKEFIKQLRGTKEKD